MDADRDPTSTDPRIGSALDNRYRILRRLGEGGSGVVYEARHEAMDRLVAIKVLRASLFRDDASDERFRREARAAGRLRHPNVVTVHDFGRSSQGEPFLVMEACEGGSLADRLRAHGALDPADAFAVFLPVCSAVGAAHRAGILHRDLKPGNVLFAGGQPKISDFGLAKMIGDEGNADATITAGHVIGSPAYMSPEQCASEPVSPASDVYSLGLMLIETLTGRLPFANPSLGAIFAAHLTGQLVDPANLGVALDAELLAILRQAVAREAASRFADAARLAEALHALVDGPAQVTDSRIGRAISARVRRLQVAMPNAPIGRERELAQLDAALEAARAGHGALATIAGEPGLGKSTLLAAFLARIEAQDPNTVVTLGRCSEHFGESEPYLPFFDALGGLLAGPQREQTERVLRAFAPSWAVQLPVLAPSPSGVPSETPGRDRMPREFGDALIPLADGNPVVLALEDLHWADASSVDLLSYLTSRLPQMPVLVVATYRPEDVERTGHPLRQLLRRLRHGGSVVEIAPRALDHDALAALCERELETPPSAALVELVARVTEGNPLFIVNALRHLEDSGALVRRGGRVELAGGAAELEASVPLGLMGLLEEKIERLEDEERQLLQAASVCGDTFEAAIVARLVNRDELDVEETLADIARRHRLVEAVGEIDYPGGHASMRFRFVHALYQNALYASLVGRRKTLWHRGAAAALRALYGRRFEPVAVAIAIHLEHGRELEAAIAACVEAADMLGRANPRDARPVLARALAIAERLDTEEGQVRRIELLVRIARHDAETAELVGDVALYDRAEALAAQALTLDPSSAEARTTLGLIHLERGANLTAFRDFTSVIERDSSDGAAWDGLAYLFKNTGLWDEALVAADRAAACEDRFAHSIRRLSVLLFQGRVDDAVAEAEALVARRPRFSHYAYWRGIAAFYAGDIAGCREWVERGVRFDPDDQIGQGVLAFVLATQGEVERARELLALAAPGAMADGTFTYWIANVYAVLGERTTAIEWIRRAVNLGYWNAPWIAQDRAIENLRSEADFERLLADVIAKHESFAATVRPHWATLVGSASGA